MTPDDNDDNKPADAGTSGTLPASESMVIEAIDETAPRDSQPSVEASESMVIEAVDEDSKPEPKPADSAELLAIEATAQKRHDTDATWPKPRIDADATWPKPRIDADDSKERK